MKEVEKELRRAKKGGMLNIQLLVVSSLSHSSSSSECVEGKAYNEKIQFTHRIIQNIIQLEHMQLSFCVEANDVGMQESRQDQELRQQIQCALKNQKKTKLRSNILWMHKQCRRMQRKKIMLQRNNSYP